MDRIFTSLFLLVCLFGFLQQKFKKSFEHFEISQGDSKLHFANTPRRSSQLNESTKNKFRIWPYVQFLWHERYRRPNGYYTERITANDSNKGRQQGFIWIYPYAKSSLKYCTTVGKQLNLMFLHS